MTPRRVLITFAVLALLLGAFGVGSYLMAQTQSKGPTWEYKLIGMELLPRTVEVAGKSILMADALEGEFNHNGQEGWELVTTFPGEEKAIFVVFRRPK